MDGDVCVSMLKWIVNYLIDQPVRPVTGFKLGPRTYGRRIHHNGMFRWSRILCLACPVSGWVYWGRILGKWIYQDYEALKSSDMERKSRNNCSLPSAWLSGDFNPWKETSAHDLKGNASICHRVASLWYSFPNYQHLLAFLSNREYMDHRQHACKTPQAHWEEVHVRPASLWWKDFESRGSCSLMYWYALTSSEVWKIEMDGTIISSHLFWCLGNVIIG